MARSAPSGATARMSRAPRSERSPDPGIVATSVRGASREGPLGDSAARPRRIPSENAAAEIGTEKPWSARVFCANPDGASRCSP